LRIPDGDTLPRQVCAACGTVHYQNPKMVVGCLPEWEGQVLLCKRAIEPRLGCGRCRRGSWRTARRLPRARCARRWRPCAPVVVGELYTVISLPQINQIYVMFRARLAALDFGPGPESLDVRLFDEDDVPWDELAFRTITRTLRNYFLDRKLGGFPVHVSALERRVPVKPDLLGAG
jgi:ADP-ribose pyrophosphatase YjhB (NUDIX family)